LAGFTVGRAVHLRHCGWLSGLGVDWATASGLAAGVWHYRYGPRTGLSYWIRGGTEVWARGGCRMVRTRPVAPPVTRGGSNCALWNWAVSKGRPNGLIIKDGSIRGKQLGRRRCVGMRG